MTSPLKDGSLIDSCIQVLHTAHPSEKVAAAHAASTLMQNFSGKAPLPNSKPPDRPARPIAPKLVAPNDVPRRRLGSIEGRAALLHAVAHIEFNAIDLAFDMAARFYNEIFELDLDVGQFLRDWVSIGAEEATHFSLINSRLQELGTSYGDHPAHDGLWEAAVNTTDSVLARLAIAPMVLEARGLDVTPGMITKLKQNVDTESADILQRIYNDEIGHVTTGTNWFLQVCKKTGKDPTRSFRDLVETRFHGRLKEPFNHEARQNAGINIAFYQD